MTRTPAGVTLSTATSTVMVVQWGSEWNVQRVRVTGIERWQRRSTRSGSTTPRTIAPVPRAETWVWGTGHTSLEGIGTAAEGVVVTLGDGVNQNANETTVAVATEYNVTAIDFEVWALQHPDLAVSHTFVNDGGNPEPAGDTGDLILDLPVPAATANRMALSYNSQDGYRHRLSPPDVLGALPERHDGAPGAASHGPALRGLGAGDRLRRHAVRGQPALRV